MATSTTVQRTGTSMTTGQLGGLGDYAIQLLPIALIVLVVLAIVLSRRRRQKDPPARAAAEPNFGSRTDGKKFCFECGTQISARAEICPNCGVRQMAPTGGFATTVSGRSRIAAALFALLLGGLGIHKFYLGQTGWGVLYLLFCLTLIPAIVGFIEGILFLVMSDQTFAAQYG